MTTARLLGIDVTDQVVTWGRLEQVKDALLARAELFTSEMQIEVRNERRQFSTGRAPESLLGGVRWYNAPLDVEVDGSLVYRGLVRDVQPGAVQHTAVLVSENVLRRPAESAVEGTFSGQNPASFLLARLREVVGEDQLDATSFQQAAGVFSSAGATINVAAATGANVTVMQIINAVSDLCSLSVFETSARLTCRAFRPYQGAEAGLRWEIGEALMREPGRLEHDYSTFNNRVVVGYPTAQAFTLEDEESIRQNGVVRTVAFSAGSAVVAADLTSARFFATLYLSRAAFRRAKLSVAGGSEFRDVRIGDRHPVTLADLGLSRHAFEVIEVRRSLDTDEVELWLASLAAGA